MHKDSTWVWSCVARQSARGDSDDDGGGAFIFYSKHHVAERWSLKFGNNTTEKIENSRAEAPGSNFFAQIFWVKSDL